MNNEEEIWKEHPVYGYEVSSLGRVRGKLTPFLKPSLNTYGYLTVGINRMTKTVHRIVVETFIGHIPASKNVNHKDGNKFNNRLDNLEVITPSQNTRHYQSNRQRDNEIKRPKLTENDVLNMYESRKQGVTVKQLSEQYNRSVRYIRLILAGTRWKYIHQNIKKAA